MFSKTLVRKNEYRDSVQLMQAAASAMKVEGVETASLMMGTDNNKKILLEAQLLTTEAETASPKDIIISIRAISEKAANEGLQVALEKLQGVVTVIKDDEQHYKSTRAALIAVPYSNLVVISVPGEYAAREARIALEANKNVFLFSDNVTVEEEIELKLFGKKRGLLVMGPDCGTAIIKGKGIGFANVVRKGSIGIVGASGTGLQEVTSLIHLRGRGVSHAIGTGGRDVKDAVGGISMLTGLTALSNDPGTKIIVIVSKPPQKVTMKKILTHARSLKKPVVVNFLGTDSSEIEELGFLNAPTLEAAAYIACKLDENGDIEDVRNWNFDESKQTIQKIVKREIDLLLPEQRFVRGLFAGGTFTSEALQILSKDISGNFYSNISGRGVNPLSDLKSSVEHTIIDLGDDIFTVGKPHPMIDQTYRKERMLQEARDPSTAVILLDFVLGFGSHPDPVEDIIDTIKKVRAQKQYISIVAHVCGTDLDPQNYERSIRMLQENEVITMPTNAQAARITALIASRGAANIWK